MLRPELRLLKIKAAAGPVELKTQIRQHVYVTVTQQRKTAITKQKDALSEVNGIYSTAIL